MVVLMGARNARTEQTRKEHFDGRTHYCNKALPQQQSGEGFNNPNATRNYRNSNSALGWNDRYQNSARNPRQSIEAIGASEISCCIGGHRPTENNYRVNGISANDYSNGSPGRVQGAQLGVDAIQEFSVLTANYTAEYGRTSGGVIQRHHETGHQ